MNNESDRAPGGASPSVTEVLKRARGRIAKGWTQGASARNRHGTIVRWYAPTATQWCMDGALCAEADPIDWDTPYSEASRLLGLATTEHYTAWQDAAGRTRAEVLAAFDRAIALSEGHAPEAPNGK